MFLIYLFVNLSINKSLNDKKMRTIDGVRYISRKEYAEIKDITVGRVSQLTDLPLVKFEDFGIEVINFDLISLSDTEKSLAQNKFQTATPIHELSYKDLGNYFGGFVMDLVNFKGSADIKYNDLQTKATDLRQKFEVCESEKSELSIEVYKLKLEVSNLTSQIEEKEQKHKNLVTEFENLKTVNEELNLNYDTVSKEHQDLKIVQSDSKHELEIKIIENKNLSAENESLKARLSSMELSAKSDADFKEEFKTFKELVMKKIN